LRDADQEQGQKCGHSRVVRPSPHDAEPPPCVFFTLRQPKTTPAGEGLSPRRESPVPEVLEGAGGAKGRPAAMRRRGSEQEERHPDEDDRGDDDAQRHELGESGPCPLAFPKVIVVRCHWSPSSSLPVYSKK